MNDRKVSLDQIKKEFLKDLDAQFPENAFTNTELLIRSFKGAQSLYNKAGQQIKPEHSLDAGTFNEILQAIENGETKYYSKERFKRTLTRDLSISDEMINKLQLNDPVDILKTEAILYNVLFPVTSKIFELYSNEDGSIAFEAYNQAVASFYEDIRNNVLAKIYSAKTFDLPATKAINQLTAHVKAISEVINPPDNEFFLKQIEMLEELKGNVLTLDDNNMQLILEKHNTSFYRNLHKYLDKINIPYQEQINHLTTLLKNHYVSLSQNENSPSPNIKTIEAIKGDIKKLEAEMSLLNLKTTQVIAAIEIAMGEKYNPHIKQTLVDEVFLPEKYQKVEGQTVNTLDIYQQKYNQELKKATVNNTNYELAKIRFLENINEQKQFANNFIDKSITYTDKSVNNALAGAYFNAIFAYQKKYPGNDELNDKFGNTFKEIFNFDLNKVLSDETERLKLIEKYPTRQFVELFNKTFDALADKILPVNFFGVNDKTNDAQNSLAAELNKVKSDVESYHGKRAFDPDLIQLKGNHIEPDYQKLVSVEDKKVGNANAYIANLIVAQRELASAHEKAVDAISFAKNAKDNLIDASEREQQKNLAKKEKKDQTQHAKWKERKEVFRDLTGELQTFKLNDQTEDAFAKEDELFRQFRIVLNNAWEKINNEFLHASRSQLDPLKNLNQFLREVRDKNQNKSQRVPLNTVYVEIFNNKEFRAVLEDKFIKNEITQFMEATRQFNELPLVEVRSIKKVKAKNGAATLYANVNPTIDNHPSSEASFKTNPIYKKASENLSGENILYQPKNSQSENIPSQVRPNSDARTGAKLNQATHIKPKSDEELLRVIVTKLTNKRDRNLLAKFDPLDTHFKKVQSINSLLKSLETSLREKRSYEDALKNIFSDANLNKAYNKIMKQNNLISFFSKNKDSLIKRDIDKEIGIQKRKSLDDLQKEMQKEMLKEMPKQAASKKSFFG